MKKRVFSILMILAVVLALSGCGCSSNSNDKASNNSSTSDSEKKQADIKQITVGQTADVGFASMSIDKFEISEGYSFEVVKNDGMFTYRSSISCPSGMKLVCIRGNFTNNTNKEYYTSNNGVYGTMKVNGSEYKMKLKCYNEADAKELTSVVPMQTVSSYFYAEVPSNVADNIQECIVDFGFNQDLNPASVTISSATNTSKVDLTYWFELKEIPTQEQK